MTHMQLPIVVAITYSVAALAVTRWDEGRNERPHAPAQLEVRPTRAYIRQLRGRRTPGAPMRCFLAAADRAD